MGEGIFFEKSACTLHDYYQVGGLLKFKSIIPDNIVRRAFNEMMETLIESIMSNHEKAQALGVVRDLLLPRLVSGFINLAEIENV